MSVNFDLGLEITIRQDFDRILGAPNQAKLVQCFGCNWSIDPDLDERSEIDDLPGGPENVRESSLVWHALLKRQLTAFKTDANTSTGAGLLALRATASGFAFTRTMTTPNARAVLVGALIRFQI